MNNPGIERLRSCVDRCLPVAGEKIVILLCLSRRYHVHTLVGMKKVSD